MKSPIQFEGRLWAHVLGQSLLHPRRKVGILYCTDCDIRYQHGNCPICGKEIGHSPKHQDINPVPWYGSLIVMVLGLITVVIGCLLKDSAVSQLGGYLATLAAGTLFGLGVKR
jgi:hypothetical protein